MRITEKEIDITPEELVYIYLNLPTSYKEWLLNTMERITKVKFKYDKTTKEK